MLIQECIDPFEIIRKLFFYLIIFIIPCDEIEIAHFSQYFDILH